MHQSARLLNHISLFHLRINKIWTLTSAQTLHTFIQCRRRDWNLGAWFNDSVLKTGAPAQFLKDLSVWSSVCAAGTVEVLRAAVSMLNAESMTAPLYVQVLLSADWRSPAHRPHHFTPCSHVCFVLSLTFFFPPLLRSHLLFSFHLSGRSLSSVLLVCHGSRAL